MNQKPVTIERVRNKIRSIRTYRPLTTDMATDIRGLEQLIDDYHNHMMDRITALTNSKIALKGAMLAVQETSNKAMEYANAKDKEWNNNDT